MVSSLKCFSFQIQPARRAGRRGGHDLSAVDQPLVSKWSALESGID